MEDAKVLYEISKLTNPTKQILDDFNSSIVTMLLGTYLKTFGEERFDMLDRILDNWESNIIRQKHVEIDTLATQVDSMVDMTIGAELAGTTNLPVFKKDVAQAKDLIKKTIGTYILDD